MKQPFILIITFFCLITTITLGQGARQISQFSGLVVGGDSLYGIPGVVLVVKKAGRGTITNDKGYFSLATLAGDTIEISALGYKRKSVVVPKTDAKSHTVVIELTEDTIMLPIIEVFPYPTEALFKQAFLAMHTPDQEKFARMYANMDPATLQRLLINSAMSSSESQKYSLRNQLYMSGAYSQGFQIFNPFAWKTILKSFKKSDKQKNTLE